MATYLGDAAGSTPGLEGRSASPATAPAIRASNSNTGAVNAIEATAAGTGSAAYGETSNVNGFGLAGRNTSTTTVGSGAGVLGEAASSALSGVRGNNTGQGYGIVGTTASTTADAIYGSNTGGGSGAGVRGAGTGSGVGVLGTSSSGNGVKGTSTSSSGVYGTSSSSLLLEAGVKGVGSSTAAGVLGNTPVGATGHGVIGYASGGGYGVYAYSFNNHAGYFDGTVNVVGWLYKSGGGFRIDHPLDPGNKELIHAFVESPEMKNVYDGVVVADDAGEAEVAVPEYVDALNGDFRYQLTAIGGAAPALHVKRELQNHVFVIAGASAGQKVCWQLTGVRKDPWALANRPPVERDKSGADRGRYWHPLEHGQPQDRGINAELRGQA